MEKIRWLRSNALATLPGRIFGNTVALTELHLGRNALTILPEGIFGNLTALETLTMEGNALECLPVIQAEMVEVLVDPYGDECGCSTADVTNVCGQETCAPGEYGYSCGATSLGPVPAPTPVPTLEGEVAESTTPGPDSGSTGG
eukprot:g19909.t1